MCKQSISYTILCMQEMFLNSHTDRSAILCALGAIIMSYFFQFTFQRCSMNKFTLNIVNVCESEKLCPKKTQYPKKTNCIDLLHKLLNLVFLANCTDVVFSILQCGIAQEY